MATGATAVYGLPYPRQTDAVDVAADVQSLATNVETQLLLKAPLSSPTFTGTVSAPTPNDSDNSTKIATTAFVKNQGYLTTASAASNYATIISPTFTGTPAAPTASLGTNTTQIATTGFVANALANFVTLPSQSGANGKFLSSNGTTASWNTITIKDVSTLENTLNNLSSTYSPLQLSTTTSSGSYSLVLTDNGKIIEMSNGGTLTISSSVGFLAGTSIIIVQTGSSQVTIAGSGVTVYGTPGLKLRAQWSSATLIKRSDGSWLALGDLSV
jgi:hypothetical protein